MNRFDHPVEFKREFDALEKVRADPRFKGDSPEAIHNRVSAALDFLAKWDSEPSEPWDTPRTFDA